MSDQLTGGNLANEKAERYSRQIRFAGIGVEGQNRLASSHALIIGCGALGSVASEMLVRAGVGTVTLVDRDFVESSNLQRQSLYTEADAAACTPKAVAAANHLRDLNSAVDIRPVVADCTAENIESLLSGVDVVCDGTDNFQTRHLINDACCALNIPWVYAACVGAYACSWPIIPGETPCFACVQDELPAAGDSPTCDSSGIIAPAVHLAATWQITEVLKILSGNTDQLRKELWASDLWQGTFQRLDLSSWRHDQCSACGTQPSRPFLNAKKQVSITLCGRDGLQITRPAAPDMDRLAQVLAEHIQIANDYLIRWQADELTATCFKDGRIIIQGTQDETRARTFLDRWLG